MNRKYCPSLRNFLSQTFHHLHIYRKLSLGVRLHSKPLRILLFLAVCTWGLGQLSCSSANSDLEVTVGTDVGILIPNKTQSCLIKYKESKVTPIDGPLFDIPSKYFSIRRPRLSWSDPESNLEILSIFIKSNDKTSCNIQVTCSLAADEMSILFGIPSVSKPAELDDSKLWNGVLYGTSTAGNKTCKENKGNGESTQTNGLKVTNDCNYRQGSGLCHLTCGGVTAAKEGCTGSATLTVIGIKTDSQGNQFPVRSSIPITLENVF